MKKFTVAFFALFIITGSTMKAQTLVPKWIFGIGTNVVDDNGHQFSHFFEFDQSWEILPYPSRLSAERVFSKGFSLEAVGTVNQLKAGKLVDKVVSAKTTTYVAFDIDLKYNLSFIIDPDKYLIKPYILYGYGYADRGRQNMKVIKNNVVTYTGPTGSLTNNLGAGFNIWLDKNEKFGLSLQTVAKLVNKYSSNHFQHSLSFVYQIKGTSTDKESKATIEKTEIIADAKPDTIATTPKETETIAADTIRTNASDTLKLNPVKPAEEVSAPEVKDLVFKVQIAKLQHNPNKAPWFKKKYRIDGEVEALPADGGTRYVCGKFPNYQAAKELRDKLRAAGAKDAFVVAFKNGTLIPVQEAIRLSGKK